MTATVPLAGVIGWPIGHSRSPRIHGHWLREYRIDGYYIPLGIAPEDFETSVRQLPRMGFVGANVTIPHKEAALAMADEVTQTARRIGAANTLTFRDGAILADNTDAYGFIQNLKTGASDWAAAAGPALVLGAGGAARAILFALLQAGVPDIRLANRTPDRATALSQEFGARVTAVPWTAISDASDGAHTIVNTTALGMTGQPPLEIDLLCAPGSLVTDAVYAPLETPLLRQARDRGMIAVDGLGMLLHQAVPGFHRWFGVEPAVTDDLRSVVLA